MAVLSEEAVKKRPLKLRPKRFYLSGHRYMYLKSCFIQAIK